MDVAVHFQHIFWIFLGATDLAEYRITEVGFTWENIVSQLLIVSDSIIDNLVLSPSVLVDIIYGNNKLEVLFLCVMKENGLTGSLKLFEKIDLLES